MRSWLPWKRFLFKQQDSDLSEQPPDVMAANGSKTLIAFRTFGKVVRWNSRQGVHARVIDLRKHPMKFTDPFLGTVTALLEAWTF